MASRAKLRSDGRVRRVLQVFWETAQRGGIEGVRGGGDAFASSLGFDEYVSMMKRIYR